MKIENGIRPKTLKIMDCHRDVRGMNLGARTGLDWDKLNDGTKRKITSAVEGEQTKGSADGLKNETVYVIVETNKKCENGDFSFEIQQ